MVTDHMTTMTNRIRASLLPYLRYRIHLRQGARVLVDWEDRDDFDDVLAGKAVEPKPQGKSLPPSLLP